MRYVIGFSRVDCIGSLNLESTHPCCVFRLSIDPHSPSEAQDAFAHRQVQREGER